uniref:Transmembrane protein n=1 Tax=Rhabditophanes sp. KR3021 TaxID=114890 RepID=A0AC35UF47_9BILA
MTSKVFLIFAIVACSLVALTSAAAITPHSNSFNSKDIGENEFGFYYVPRMPMLSPVSCN